MRRKFWLPVFLMVCTVLFFGPVYGVDNETCLECHADKGLTVARGTKQVSLYVDSKILASSVHQAQACIDCHPDADVEEFPHPETLERVTCGNCSMQG